MNAIHYLDGRWVAGNPPILGPLSHATWMASVVFDGARAFEGVTPDLDLHCQRLIGSAMGASKRVMQKRVEAGSGATKNLAPVSAQSMGRI